MPSLPLQFLNSLTQIALPDPEGFIQVHESGEQLTSLRFNPFKPCVPEFQKGEPVPWSSTGFYLHERPSFTRDPLFQAGCYYVQEAGSMFLEFALKQCLDLSRNIKVLDLCAAPGGKSCVLNSIISKDSLLVSNELIQNRAQILAYNLSKWGQINAVVTNNAPEQFEQLSGFFDLLVVDAPCSGSGLFRKQEEAMEEWSPAHVSACALRQKNLLNSALISLKEDGLLFYSTCSYSKEENEDIVDWLRQEKGMEVLPLVVQKDWGIVQNEKGLRFYPHLVKSEGFFCSILTKKRSESAQNRHLRSKHTVSVEEKKVLDNYVNSTAGEMLKKNEKFYLMNQACFAFLQLPLQGLYFKKAGVCIGELKNRDLIPDHELALSVQLSEKVQKAELTRDTALSYLKKDLFVLPGEYKGLLCFTHQNHGLGWGKALPNRINNYLPQHLRVLK